MKLIEPRQIDEPSEAIVVRPTGAPAHNNWNRSGIVLLLLTCAVVLACRVFPSQDGPVHLYYVDIIRDLLRHEGPYVGHFEIKSLLTPYASEYFVLLVLETVFSPETSEKLLVCGYVFAFGLAFRYLVNSVTREAGAWTIAAIPFCMHTLVYMGFMNYCLAVTLAMFLAGYWTRWSAEMNLRRLALLAVAFVLMLLTHPIPVAVFLIYAGLNLAAGIWQYLPNGNATVSERDKPNSAVASAGIIAAFREHLRPIVTLAALGAVAVVWLAFFVKPSPASPPPAGTGIEKVSYLANMLNEARLSPLVPFIAPYYRAGMLVLSALAAIALLAGLWKHRGKMSPAALATVATSGICFTLYAVVPISINGSFFFPQRFPIFWIVFLFAAAAAFRPPRAVTTTAGVIAILATLVALDVQFVNTSVMTDFDILLRPYPAPSPGSTGLVVGELPPHPKGFAFDPYFWGSAHYFRKSRAIMANAPWLDLPIIMLRPAHPDRWYNLSAWEAGKVLADSLRTGDKVPELSFVVRQQRASGNTAEALNFLGWPETASRRGIFGIYSRPADSIRDH